MKNKKASIVDEQNDEDLAKYQAILEAYINKCLGNQRKQNLLQSSAFDLKM